MRRGPDRDKMQRGDIDKKMDEEERRKLLEELRRKRAVRAAHQERYLPSTSREPGADRTPEQVAARPGAWEQA